MKVAYSNRDYLAWALLILLFSLFGQTSIYAQDSDHNWTHYIGSYDVAAPWAKTIRGIGRKKLGMALMPKKDSVSSDPLSISGAFSGEQVKIEAGATSEFPRLLTAINAVDPTIDILLPVGGMGSGRNPEQLADYLGIIERDEGKSWKDIVAYQVRSVLAATNGQTIYWQIGNEINSKHVSGSIRKWKNKRSGIRRNDPIITDIYIEYVLAPTVEAIRRVRSEDSGALPRVKIVLGTLANARGDASRRWLNNLLSSTIKGDFAPTLAGKKVWEVVDIIALHYLVTNGGSGWEASLTDLHKKWVHTGQVDGIWSTEELGPGRAKKGHGLAVSLKIFARYMHFWLANGLSPDQSRCIYYGLRMGPAGTQGQISLDSINQFIGTEVLMPGGNLDFEPSSRSLESYLFQTTSDTASGHRKVMGFIFTEGRVGHSISHVTIVDIDLSDTIEGRAYLVSENGWVEIQMDLQRTPEGWGIRMGDGNIRIEQNQTLIFRLLIGETGS